MDLFRLMVFIVSIISSYDCFAAKGVTRWDQPAKRPTRWGPPLCGVSAATASSSSSTSGCWLSYDSVLERVCLADKSEINGVLSTAIKYGLEKRELMESTKKSLLFEKIIEKARVFKVDLGNIIKTDLYRAMLNERYDAIKQYFELIERAQLTLSEALVIFIFGTKDEKITNLFLNIAGAAIERFKKDHPDDTWLIDELILLVQAEELLDVRTVAALAAPCKPQPTPVSPSAASAALASLAMH